MEAFLSALSQVATGTYWLSLLVAIGIGTVVGFIPGVGATLVTAIMLPTVLLTIESPAVGIVFLAMVGSLNNTLDSIPAVLVGVPGSETQVTYLEGHQLARQGKAAHTLGAVYAVSMLGGVIGALALAAAIPVIKPFILQFSYTEIAVLALFGVAMVALLSRGSMAKGLAAGFLGLMLGTVGVDPLTGTARYTFGEVALWEGLPMITAILGFFALPELIDLTMTREAVASSDAKVSNREVFRGFRHGLTRWPIVIRQSLFGAFMGAIPGIGGSVIDWLSYAFGISLHKNKKGKPPENFGHGSLEGVLFAESAANSKAGGQALPTLTLGIPGSTSWAIISVAILSYGLSPGPSMVAQHQDITMLMVITLAIGNTAVALMGLLATNYLARMTRIPYPTVGFFIMGMVFLGAYMDMGAWMVFIILAFFTAIGLLMKSFAWPRPPLILGFILGPIVEQNLLSAVSIYGVVGVLTRPIAIGLMIFLVISVFTLMRLTSTAIPDEDVSELIDDGEDGDGSGGRPAPSVAGDGSDSNGKAGQASPTGGVEVLEDEAAQPQDAQPVESPSLMQRLMHLPNIAPVLIGLLGLWFAVEALSFPAGSRMVPMFTGTSVVILCVYQLIKQVVTAGKKQGQIMDLGMRSLEMEGVGRAALLLTGMIVGFFLLAMTIGLQWAAIAFVAIGPFLFLERRYAVPSSVVSGLLTFLFTEFLMDRFVGIIWPNEIIWTWITGLF